MTSTETPPDAAPEPVPDPNAVNLTIDGVPVVARKGELVIKAAQDNGVYVPRFCYHERMSPVGMCRQCLVEVEGPRGRQLVVSCMTPVAEGQIVLTDTEQVKQSQEGIIELLLANHPLDCPVCDKGGECPLQDNTMAHGPGESRFLEEKRHYPKPIPISDLVYLDRERCILCDRCTRFADEVAGDPLIHFTHRGNNTQVLTFPDEPFSSYFSGNTVQICPVGALTAVPYRFKARPWDLSQSESTCTSCAVGCRVALQSTQDGIVRKLGVDSEAVNWGWLCDRGRFDFEAGNHPARLAAPAVRVGDGLVESTWSAALAKAAALIGDALASDGPNGIAVIGGARGTNEDAYAWARLARDVIGTGNVDAQLGDGLPAELLGLPRATIAEACAAPTVILLGPDLKEELPVLYLRLKDAVDQRRTRLIEFAAADSGLTRYAWRSVRHLPGEQATTVAEVLADETVAAQLARGPVVVVAGRSNLAEDGRHQLDALAALLAAVPGATVLPAYRRGNVVGALELGLSPVSGGQSTAETLEAAAAGKLACLILLGADPISDFPDVGLARRALAGARSVIAVDTFVTASSQHADVILAAAAYGEKAGTVTNLEGRVTDVSRQVTVRGTSRPDWMIAVELADLLGGDLGFSSLAEITAAIAADVPAYSGITAAAAALPDGILIDRPGTGRLAAGGEPARRANGYAHRLVVSRKLYDGAVGTQLSPSLAPLAGGAEVHLHPLDLDRLGGAAGTQLRVSSPTGALVLAAAPDASVPRGTAWVPFNQPNVNVAELLAGGTGVVDVAIESIGTSDGGQA